MLGQRPTETTYSGYGRNRNCRRDYIFSFGQNQNHAETDYIETETKAIRLYWTLFNTSISAEQVQVR